MAKLIYAINCSLDGYYVDADGGFDFTEPVDELHDWFADLEATVGTHLYGRKMHQVMAVWHEMAADPAITPLYQRFADAWIDSDTVVYSRTLDDAGVPRARIVRDFDAAEVAALKEGADRDLDIGGPELAGQALAAGLVDEVILAVAPVTVGGGRRALPDGVRLRLELLEQRVFSDGTVLLRYAVL
ncbi:dihydrofolate reductase family protein [Demequina phytophila]|uniref:dihydrofolate reductase family protein n=1 Tax=Demequina phytophila TaxID=1638981 RepID=UPI000782BAF5|nr:dihydrofolate reductase family protein [Demequina phytophila]